MQHLTGDQFNGETALRVANFPRYTCMIVNIVTYFILIRFMMNYLNFKFFIVLLGGYLGSLEKKYTHFSQKFFMFIEQYLFFCVKIVSQISKCFFFSFDFLINTWYFFISRIHCYHNTCRCMFVCFLFCLFWNFEETREKTLLI